MNISIHFISKGLLLNTCDVSRYGFRSPPHLELKAQPKLGERKVTLAPVTDWIENKLDKEFQVYKWSMSFYCMVSYRNDLNLFLPFYRNY